MNARPNLFGISGGPLAQALSVVVFGVLLVGAVIMGAVLGAAILGVAVVAWIGFSVRLWWLRSTPCSTSEIRVATRATARRVEHRPHLCPHDSRRMVAVRPKRKSRIRLVPVIGYIILVLGLAWLFEEQPTTTIIFVRHAETDAAAGDAR